MGPAHQEGRDGGAHRRHPPHLFERAAVTGLYARRRSYTEFAAGGSGYAMQTTQRNPACCADCTPTATSCVTCSVVSCEAGVVILLDHISRPVSTSVKVMSAAYAILTCSPP